ncbi:MAG: CBS domain-containing protein [Kofleriaceae bacterium]|nr:CBS domain-containing protein [Kofleriaceae bacterium]
MKSVARSAYLSDFDDDPTSIRATLGSLIRGPALAVELETPLAEVRRMLVASRVPAIAVVDDKSSLVGLVTRTDVLRHCDDECTAADAMSGFVFALPIESTIEKAAALMAHEGVGQVVITRNGNELAGMISALDIARHFAIEAGYLAGD